MKTELPPVCPATLAAIERAAAISLKPGDNVRLGCTPGAAYVFSGTVAHDVSDEAMAEIRQLIDPADTEPFKGGYCFRVP